MKQSYIYKKIRFGIDLIFKEIYSRQEWKQRINDVVDCPENALIPRVTNAGQIVDSCQIMHNGLKIKTGSYYGKGITKMLAENKGVHEPQEEFLFGEVLKTLRSRSTIVELGSYWSFYSMWFLKENDGEAYLFEPNKDNLKMGELNFQLNNFEGDFTNAFIAKELNLDGDPPTLNLDYIVKVKNIGFIDILHCDIQSYELDMLKGASVTIANDKIGYLFISTHSNDIHKDCLKFLEANNYLILSEADMINTYSVDGVIVARSKTYPGIDPIALSQKSVKVA